MTNLLTKLALLVLVAFLLLGCTCDSSTQPCDTDLSTRNQQQFNPPPEMQWCVQGAALVPCGEGD